MILFDIDMNEEENKEDKKDKEDKNDNNDNNDNINDIKIDETKNNDFNTLNNHKKSLFTSEDKEKLESMFNTKKNNKEIKVKKNVINIDENLLEENDDNNNDNIRINKNKNYKVLDDYAIFLDNLPKPKNIEESNEKDESITNTELNNHNEDNDNKIEDKTKKEKEKEENKTKEDKEEENEDDEYTFKQDDEIPLISDEPIIGKGVCVALQIFKNKKMLRKEEEFGRYHDKK